MRDLDVLLTREGANAQALLLRATILQVQGKYPESKASAARLLRLAPAHIAIGMMASVASLSGEGEKSYSLLAAAFENAADAAHVTSEQKVWMLTTLAEIAVRLGKAEAARQHFATALAIDENDAYTLAAYADFLIDQDQPREALHLVKDSTQVDSLLLRRAIALHAISPTSEESRRDIADLNARFVASRMRGDFMHQREEGRFALSLLKQPATALALAQKNWAVQREPADARLLLEAALAANDQMAAAVVVEWMQKTRIEDLTLASLAAKFQ